ncbi:MAG: glutamine synthetase, partial [Gammaproteobacteria bacterium]|nr:glutamine synthetase [Gammaproteobacteria bacterium]
MTVIKQWLEEHGITEIEALIPDMAGVARGKIMPAKKYTEEEGMRLPEGVFLQTVTGDYLEDESVMNPAEVDMVVLPDPGTIRKVPWAAEPTAQIIHDCFHSNGIPVDIAPRYVLRRVL